VLNGFSPLVLKMRLFNSGGIARGTMPYLL
jgi:hypothetical protein